MVSREERERAEAADAALSERTVAKMERFLREMGRVLGKDLRVSLEVGAKGTGEYAFTDARSGLVVIDPWRIDWNSPVRGWLQTKGFFYHEVMHTTTDPVKDYGIPAILPFKRTVNALSDQTGEVRFVNIYPGAKGYFAMNVFEFLLKGKVDSRTYALVYGRRSFLPARLVKAARKLMAASLGESQTKEVEGLIDAYHAAASANAPQDEFGRIGAELQRILGSMPSMDEQIARGGMTQEGRKQDANEAPAESKGDESGEQGEEQEGEGQGEGEPGEEEAEGQGAGKGAGEEGEGEGQGSEDEAGEGGEESEGEGTGEGGKAETADSDDADDGEGSDSAGTGKAPPHKSSGKMDKSDLSRAIEEMAKEMNGKAVEDAMQTAELEADELGLTGVEMQDLAAKASEELVAMLKRVQLKTQAGYEEGHKAGRLDINAWRREKMRGFNGPLEIFKIWQPDRRNETRLSVALVVDQSGSMGGGKLDAANQAAAAIATACEKSNPAMNKLMVRYFAGSDVMTKAPGQRFDAATSLDANLRGGTRPRRSIEAALGWLCAERGVKVLVILTDGEWQDWRDWDAKDAMARAEKAAVAVQVLLIDIPVRERVGLPIRSIRMDELAEVVFKLVNDAMRAQIRRMVA